MLDMLNDYENENDEKYYDSELEDMDSEEIKDILKIINNIKSGKYDKKALEESLKKYPEHFSKISEKEFKDYIKNISVKKFKI